MAETSATGDSAGKLGQSDTKVIVASSLGTVFEWYDFYLYGLLAVIISSQFFSGVNETTGFILALAAFAAGFAVRPFGALVFGRVGDIVGRKYTFLVTMGLMGFANLAHGAFAMVGGYVTVSLMNAAGVPFLLALVLGDLEERSGIRVVGEPKDTGGVQPGVLRVLDGDLAMDMLHPVVTRSARYLGDHYRLAPPVDYHCWEAD